MKKILATCLICIFCITYSISSFAKESHSLIYSGYTENGIYYEVFSISTSENVTLLSDSLSINIEIVYDGIIIPSSTIPWSETVNGIKYSGTLKLYSIKQYNGKTTANYQGIIYAN